VAIIKNRLKIDISFYTILQILSLIIFKLKEEHRKARERKRRAECDDPRVAVGPSVSSECGA